MLLSLLDATLPVLYSVIAPHSIAALCVEPRSGRVFATRAVAVASTDPTNSANATTGSGSTRAGWPAGKGAGSPASGGSDGAGAASYGFGGWTAGGGVGGDGGEGGGGGGVDSGGGVVSVLALASGSFLDRGPLR